MDEPTRHYRKQQLANLILDITGEYPPSIKLSTEHGDTNWLSITQAEARQIANILIGKSA